MLYLRYTKLFYSNFLEMKNGLQITEVSNLEHICNKSNSLFHSTTATWLLKCEKWLSLSKISVKLLEGKLTLRIEVKLQMLLPQQIYT